MRRRRPTHRPPPCPCPPYATDRTIAAAHAGSANEIRAVDRRGPGRVVLGRKSADFRLKKKARSQPCRLSDFQRKKTTRSQPYRLSDSRRKKRTRSSNLGDMKFGVTMFPADF